MIKVLDASVIILFFEARQGSDHVKALFLQALADKVSLVTTAVHWGEVRYILLRRYGIVEAQKIFTVLDTLPIEVVDVTKEMSECAASLKVQYTIGYIDAILAAICKLRKLECVTADSDFLILKEEIKIKHLLTKTGT